MGKPARDLDLYFRKIYRDLGPVDGGVIPDSTPLPNGRRREGRGASGAERPSLEISVCMVNPLFGVDECARRSDDDTDLILGPRAVGRGGVGPRLIVLGRR